MYAWSEKTCQRSALLTGKTWTALFACALALEITIIDAAATAYIVISPRVVYPNQNVSLFCITAGSPQPVVRGWKKDGSPLKLDEHVHLLLGGLQLLIQNVQVNDAGSYECITSAKINGNYISTSASLELSTFGPVQNVTHAIETSNATLICNGTNLTLVRWYRRGKLLERISRFVVGGVGETLTIVDVRASDQGQYTCEGFHSHGVVRNKVFLQVLPVDSQATVNPTKNSPTCVTLHVHALVTCDSNVTLFFTHNTNDCASFTFLFQMVSFSLSTEEIQQMERLQSALVYEQHSTATSFSVDCTLGEIYGIEIWPFISQGSGKSIIVQSYSYGQLSKTAAHRKELQFFVEYPLLQIKLVDANCTCLGRSSDAEIADGLYSLLAGILGEALSNLANATFETNSARSQMVVRTRLKSHSLYKTLQMIKLVWRVIRQRDSAIVGHNGCLLRFDINCKTLFAKGITEICRTDDSDGCSQTITISTKMVEKQSSESGATILIVIGLVTGVTVVTLLVVGITYCKKRTRIYRL